MKKRSLLCEQYDSEHYFLAIRERNEKYAIYANRDGLCMLIDEIYNAIDWHGEDHGMVYANADKNFQMSKRRFDVIRLFVGNKTRTPDTKPPVLYPMSGKVLEMVVGPDEASTLIEQIFQLLQKHSDNSAPAIITGYRLTIYEFSPN